MTGRVAVANRVAVTRYVAYLNKLKNLFGANIVGLWPQNESSGTTSYDIGGRGFNGAYTGVTLGVSGIGDYNTATSFDGTTSFNNVYSAGLAGAFNGAAGTLLAWTKVSGAGVWTDGAARKVAEIGSDVNNRVLIFKNTVNNQFVLRYAAGGTIENISLSGQSNTGWVSWCITWSGPLLSNLVTAYKNGVSAGTSGTLGTYSGTVASDRALIGCGPSAPLDVWSGSIGPVLLLNRAATADEVATASVVS